MSLDYRNGQLSIGIHSPVLLSEITANFNDPVYVYDLDHIRLRIHQLCERLKLEPYQIHYAVKANFTPALLEFIASLGVGADVVSSGELKLALSCGFKPEHIIYSGVSKSHNDLKFALENNVGQINVESLAELERIGEMSHSHSHSISVGLRLNPNVNALTHPYIATGFKDNKFGVELESLPAALEIIQRFKNLRLNSLALHIGSQLVDFAALDEAIEKTIDQAQRLKVQFSILDIGGGIGIDYGESFVADDLILEKYALVIAKYQKLSCPIHIEPGRFLVARAGTLLGRIEYIKPTPYKNFVILNTGMHHLIRPALYNAHHRILPFEKQTTDGKTYDVVGPICESSDFLAKGVQLPSLAAGDWLACADAGAYGVAMSSHYNLQPWPHTVFVENGKWSSQPRQLAKLLEFSGISTDQR